MNSLLWAKSRVPSYAPMRSRITIKKVEAAVGKKSRKKRRKIKDDMVVEKASVGEGLEVDDGDDRDAAAARASFRGLSDKA